MASEHLQPANQPSESAHGASASGNQNQAPGQVFTVHQQVVSYSGPLPTPETLAGFEQAFKGCAERIVSMAERQAKHRQECERMMLEAPIQDAKSA